MVVKQQGALTVNISGDPPRIGLAFLDTGIRMTPKDAEELRDALSLALLTLRNEHMYPKAEWAEMMKEEPFSKAYPFIPGG